MIVGGNTQVDIHDGEESYLGIEIMRPVHCVSVWIRTGFIPLPVQTLMGRDRGGGRKRIQIKGLILQVPNIRRRNLSLFMAWEGQKNCIRFRADRNQGLWT